MTHHAPLHRPNRIPLRRGLGLVELLISLSITALLLTATGMALDASFKAYRTNQEIGDLTQRARLSMHRLMTEIRVASNPDPDDDVMAIYRTGVVVDTKAIRLPAADGVHGIEYRHTGNSIVRTPVIRAGAGWSANGTPSAFLTGISAAEFNITMEPQRSLNAARTGMQCDQLRRATIKLTLREAASTAGASEVSGKQAVTLVSSVVPRRNAW